MSEVKILEEKRSIFSRIFRKGPDKGENDAREKNPEQAGPVEQDAPVEPVEPSAVSRYDTVDTSGDNGGSLYERLKKGLSKTRDNLVGKVESFLRGRDRIDEDLFWDLEEILIGADVGIHTTTAIIEGVKKRIREEGINDPSEIKGLLKEEIKRIVGSEVSHLNLQSSGMTVIMVVGVNGVGKTTTIGKLACYLKSMGKRVLLAAGDTFRAAAIEQLEVWGNRAGVEVIKHSEGSDPAAVVYDAIQAAKARRIDCLIIDTAGRLQTKVNLMEELKKVRRVISREIEGAPHEALLVVDATTGQNALSQAKQFKEATEVTGIILTKLDGTAKGGVVIAIANETGIPVKFIGVGEKVSDFREFNPSDFVEALFES